MEQLKLITHNGNFHADDVFACATLMILLEREGKQYEIIRTRDEGIIASGDYVFDIGGVDDPLINRFDHHQKGGAGVRSNTIPYASFGLVWKKYGAVVSGSETIADNIDQKLVQPIDANDNGMNLFTGTIEGVSPAIISDIVSVFRPTWKEESYDIDGAFLTLAKTAKVYLERMIVRTKDALEASAFVEDAYARAEDKRLIILDGQYPAHETLEKYPEPLFVIGPRTDEKWMVKTMNKEKNSFANRKDLPASWAGLRDAELAKVTGVADAVFCHNGRFLAVAGSKEGAIALGKLALAE